MSFWSPAVDPLEPGPDGSYVRAVEEPREEHDVEVFERIPWEALEKSGPDHRWLAYLVAMVVVLGAVGISIGRGMAPSPVTSPAVTQAPTATIPVASDVHEAPAPEPTAAPNQASVLSEADLMALPGDSLEAGAAAVAEWFVVDHFTREDGDGGRSFVDWARAGELTWLGATTIDVTVLIRRLAASGDDAYQRLPAEAWRVTTELIDDHWVVIHGPTPAQAPTLDVSLPAPEGDVPDRVASSVEDGTITGAAQVEGRWSVELQWTDDAGLTWTVREWVEDGG